LNRETILATIHRQLHDNIVETGDVRPLGEIVANVATEIRAESNGRSPTTNPGVISIEKVAAFVDGHIEPSEAELICAAVMVDNSILAEIVAAARAKRVPIERLPALPRSLSDRLLAMDPGDRVSRDAGDDSHGRFQESEIKVQPAEDQPDTDNDVRRRKRIQLAIGLLAIAVTIVFGIIILGRSGEEAPDRSVVVDDSGIDTQRPRLPSGGPDTIPPLNPQPPELRARDVAEIKPRPPRSEDRPPQADISESDSMIASAPGESEARVEDDSTDKVPMPPDELNPLLDSVVIKKVVAARGMTNVRWTEVSGLLAQRNDLPDIPGPGRTPTWKRISQRAPSSQNDASGGSVELRTLPFSRAKGEFTKGGRIVLASDTGVQITQGDSEDSVELELMYGSIAMVNLPKGTKVTLRRGNETFATLHWQRNTSVVVHRQAEGLQLQIDGGQIEIDDQPVNQGSLRIANDRSIESVPSPKRLPRWITRPEESTAVDRMILAQISDTTNLTATIDQQLRALASHKQPGQDEQRALARLAHWQAAMNGANLYRMVGSRIPAVRMAALQRLAYISQSDPRYARIWNLTERSLNNPQRLAQIRGWFRLLRGGARPNANQLEQMLSGLSSQSIAGRALSDFMLRQYVRNPPPFDPTWTGQTLQRAINVYRERARVPVDRLRPNAAAAGN
jgi:hypothetical protein